MGGKALVVIAGAAAAAAVAGGMAGFRWLKRAKKVQMRELNRQMSRPKMWYSALPVYRMRNNLGMEVHIVPVGAAITKLIVPDKNKKPVDVVLGYEDASSYVNTEPCTYFGVVVGRCANRISGAKFRIDGEEYKLLANNGPNALHGGAMGLHKRKWDVRQFTKDTYSAIELRYESPNGEEGYPGSLYVVVTYKLAHDSNVLTYSVSATTDETTPVNIAQHSYFNLAGHASGTIHDHVIQIHGDHYTPVDSTYIPTGEVLPVKGTALDFRAPQRIGDRLGKVAGGFDHNYVLFGLGPEAKALVKSNGMASDSPKLAAVLQAPSTGIKLELSTTAPGLQFYSGNFLDGSAEGKAGAAYPKHSGLCLETQGFPDAVNKPGFPSVLLQPSDEYYHETVYKFSA